MKYTEHIAGPICEDNIQRCIICGAVICDNNGVYSHDGSPPPSWPEGTLYVSNTNWPTVTMVDYPDGYDVEKCKP